MINIFVCGDIVNYSNESGHLCAPDLAAIIQGSDYAICNFEAPISGRGSPQPKSGPHHLQRKETLEGLQHQGFKLALLANNHMLDFGKAGLKATLDEARRTSIETIGAGLNRNGAYRPKIKDFKNIKVGFINASEAQFGVIDYWSEHADPSGYAWINHRIIDSTIVDLKTKCDYVLVFAHAGLENYPIPQREWRERYKLFCELGADAVIASHPHVPQGYEYYHDSLIIYSLGNFYFDGGRWGNKDNASYAAMLHLRKNKPISFDPVFHHTIGNKVHLASEKKKIDLQALCSLLDEGYQATHDKMSTAAYVGLKRKLISSMFPFPIDSTLKGTAKEILATVLGRRKNVNKSLLSLHIMRNESYNYAIRHALELKAERTKK